jgi:metallo-beta-lactamase family protein
MKPKLSFHGAVGTVTGSKYLLETGDMKVQVDAGLFQGLKKFRLMNWDGPQFDPRSVDHLILTHAHIDHSGYLPWLVKHGFSGPVHCTEATSHLADLLLKDAAKIQEEEAEYANKKGFSKHKPALPLYTSGDAQAAIDLLQPIPYEKWIDLGEGIRFRFLNAGHILGAAMVELRLPVEGQESTLVFSGDVGRFDVPLHSDPSPPPAADFMVMESTYGNRLHDHSPIGDQIRAPMEEIFEGGGTVLIPSFAVGRTQLVTLILRELINNGKLSDIPIHIDSPMAVDATRIYSAHLNDLSLDEDLLEDGRSRLFPRNVQFHRSVADSKKLNKLSGPRIIISASGMLTAGRVLHHLSRLLPEPENLVMLVGYQAAGTRGRSLLEGAKTLKIHGHQVRVRANLKTVNGLSAHADRDELLRWVSSSESVAPKIFVTHGESEAAGELSERLQARFDSKTIIPHLHEEFDLAELKNN